MGESQGARGVLQFRGRDRVNWLKLKSPDDSEYIGIINAKLYNIIKHYGVAYWKVSEFRFDELYPGIDGLFTLGNTRTLKAAKSFVEKHVAWRSSLLNRPY